MSWQNELDELREREAFAEELGGAERVKRQKDGGRYTICLLYTSPSPRDGLLSRMPSSA